MLQLRKIEKLKEALVVSKWNWKVATNIHLDHPSPLGSNGPHCFDFLHEMKELLLNLVPSEPLGLVKELACFDNSI